MLITGITGFLAAHVLDAVLAASPGYRVRGTVRDLKRGQTILTPLSTADRARVELVEVKDGATSDLTNAVRDVAYILHVASPYQLNVQDPVRDLLTPAIETTLNVLRAAKASPSVKKIVLTSSFAAVTNFTKGGPNRPGYTYTVSDWNPLTYEDAVTSGGRGAVAYSASKTLAEKAAWDFMQQEAPAFTLSTINPPMIYGPCRQPVTTKEALNTSSKAIYHLIDSAPKMPEDRLPLFCHVRDVALAHVKAMEASDDLGGDQRTTQRYLICGGAFYWCQAVALIAAKYPHLKARLPQGYDGAIRPDAMKDPSQLARVDTSLAAQKLGLKTYHGWESTLEESLTDLLRLEDLWLAAAQHKL